MRPTWAAFAVLAAAVGDAFLPAGVKPRARAAPAMRCSESPRVDEALGFPRRMLIVGAAAAALPSAAWAISDPTVSKFATQAPPTAKDSEPFTYLDSGVSYRCGGVGTQRR
jgi:hypothetical protein